MPLVLLRLGTAHRRHPQHAAQAHRLHRRGRHIIMFSSMLIAFAYVVVMTGLWTGSISMGDLYRLLVDNGDVIYDELAGRIFYKGSLYLGVAVIVFAFWKGRWAKVGLCISFIAVLLTVTRGFVLALFSVFLLYTLGKPGRLGAKVITICILFIVGGMFIPEFFSLAGDQSRRTSRK